MAGFDKVEYNREYNKRYHARTGQDDLVRKQIVMNKIRKAQLDLYVAEKQKEDASYTSSQAIREGLDELFDLYDGTEEAMPVKNLREEPEEGPKHGAVGFYIYRSQNDRLREIYAKTGYMASEVMRCAMDLLFENSTGVAKSDGNNS